MYIFRQVIVGYAVVRHHAQWNREGFYLCSTPGCGVTTHSECHVPFLYGDAENSNLGGGKRFSARHQKYTPVTGKKKMADYKVCNNLGCKHMDPKGWKFEQHKCYVQKEWREGCAIEDLVSLKCLHCHSLWKNNRRQWL